MTRKGRHGALVAAVMMLGLLVVPVWAAWSWQRLSANAGTSQAPAIAVGGVNSHVVWEDTRDGSSGIRVASRTLR